MKNQWWNQWTEIYAKIGNGEAERSYHLLILLFFKRQQDLSETSDWWNKTWRQLATVTDAEFARSLAEQLRRVIICGGFVGQAARLYEGIENAFRFFREAGAVASMMDAFNQLELREVETDAMGEFFEAAVESWEVRQGFFVPDRSIAELLARLLKAEAGVSIYDPWAEGGSLLLRLLNSKNANQRPLLLGQPAVQARQTEARRKLLIMMKMISGGVWAELLAAGQAARRSGYQRILSAPAAQLTETMLTELLGALSYDGRAVLYCRKEPTAGARKRLAQTAELVELLILPAAADALSQVWIFDHAGASTERLAVWDFRSTAAATDYRNALWITEQYEQGCASAWRRECVKSELAIANGAPLSRQAAPSELAADNAAALEAIIRLTKHFQQLGRGNEAVGEATVGELLECILRCLKRAAPEKEKTD